MNFLKINFLIISKLIIEKFLANYNLILLMHSIFNIILYYLIIKFALIVTIYR